MVDASSPLIDAAPHDVQATFCATLVDEWIGLGVNHAVVAPGSRSTPMALALTDRKEMHVHVVHDERVAAFVALGLGLPTRSSVSGIPALLLCTSGTAAANFMPAVAEAGLSHVPMIVLTADRPEELRNVGAPQTIDQIDLYGSHVRWFHDPNVAVANTAHEWRPLASTALSKSADGPVHLNLAFREPLLGRTRELPARIDHTSSVAETESSDSVPLDFDRERGVILVGGSHGVDLAKVIALHEATSWPIIADPLSGIRAQSTVTTVDALLRDLSFTASNAADVIVRVGRPSTSKVLAQWTARPEVVLIQVGGPGRIDPGHNVRAVCTIDALLATQPTGATGTPWLDSWTQAECRADEAIGAAIDGVETLTEPAVARFLARYLPTGAGLTVSSSMPVRDLEWFGGRLAAAHCNRGANGIDGVMSTAVGRCLADPDHQPHFVLIGDLAFVHDSNALVALTDRTVDLRVVILDNDGGGIFSFLPQSDELAPERFEQLFGTPLGTDVLKLAEAHGIQTMTVTTRAELVDQIARPGPWVCRVPSDRAANVVDHTRLHAAVSAALTQTLPSGT
jgi:2-succinyl-5-enolpyruvyl-6-hydroxy-3-cyclohexene-1-carboxylate synthase